MHLKMGNTRFGPFLPTVRDIRDNEIRDKFQTADVFNDKKHEESVAGDTRVSENPTLTSYHTMFARLHNLAVDEFIKLNPDWNANKVFQEARLLVMSITKQINYAEHIPVLLGAQQIKLLTDLKVSRGDRRARTMFVKEGEGPGEGARSNGVHQPPAENNPQIRQEFLFGYRWGHAQVTEDVTAATDKLNINRSRDLKDSFFDPDLMHVAGPGIAFKAKIVTLKIFSFVPYFEIFLRWMSSRCNGTKVEHGLWLLLRVHSKSLVQAKQLSTRSRLACNQ